VFNLRYIFLFLSTLLISFLLLTNYKLNIEKDVLFEINSGSTLQEVTSNLIQKNLILNGFIFKLNAKLHNIEERVKAGEYLITKNESTFTLQKKFIKGEIYYRKLQLLEGKTILDVLKLGESEGLIDDINGDIEQFKFKLGIKGQTEGLLYPDTFYFQKGDTFSSLLRRSFNKQESIYSELWSKRKENLPYSSLLEAITLASIIEKEGLEKEKIASVFINRLNKKMKLQSDPTVIYSLGSQFDGNIKRSDLRIDNPYNTYKYKGLPPGPIGLVSLSSMKAALNPMKSDYLYFVSKNDGFHKFSKTLEEHNQAVLKYQINAR
tara:strand:- start:1654 stop:2616 length:963 start_codon:yes stop_codon:yes gene_type:complete